MWSKPLACRKYFQQFFKALQCDTFGYKNSFSSCSVYIVNSETNQRPDIPQFWVNKYINCNNNTQALQNRCTVYNKFNYSQWRVSNFVPFVKLLLCLIFLILSFMSTPPLPQLAQQTAGWLKCFLFHFKFTLISYL